MRQRSPLDAPHARRSTSPPRVSAAAAVPQPQPPGRRRSDDDAAAQPPPPDAASVDVESDSLLTSAGRAPLPLHAPRAAVSARRAVAAATPPPLLASACAPVAPPSYTLLLLLGVSMFLFGVIAAPSLRGAGGVAGATPGLLPRPSMPLLWVDVHGAGGPGSPTRREVFSLPEGSTATVAQLRASVAASLGVPAAYVALFRRREAVERLLVAAREPGLLLTALGADKSAHGVRDALAAEAVRIAREETTPLVAAGVRPGDAVDAYLRPLRGDHVHVAFAAFHRGRRLAQLADRPVVGLTAEGGHVTNVFPHFGVHTGGPGWYDNGVVHVHPGTSWSWFAGVEGCGCTLGAFLEAVGVVVWAADSPRYPAHAPVAAAPPLTGGAVCIDAAPELRYAETGAPVPAAFGWAAAEYGVNRSIVCDTAAEVWRAYVWASIDDVGRPPATVVSGAASLDRLWLPYADAMVTLSYEARDAAQGGAGYEGGGGEGGRTAVYPYPLPATVDAIRRVMPDGFDGRLYPRTPEGVLSGK